ncbi:Alpha-amylase A type-1/2 [Bulinus truncatus]|nr:Alpha-amylase A type-1/2 [Bulinus truncatus]
MGLQVEKMDSNSANNNFDQWLVLIVGAGPVGTLAALYFAMAGHKVKLFEKQPACNRLNRCCGRSINLTTSPRGLAALQGIGQDHLVTSISVAVDGRVVHSLNGSTRMTYYGQNKEVNNGSSSDDLRHCQLLYLPDLDQAQDYVRSKIVNLLDRLVDHGSIGFRVDAAKHIHPEDLKYIYENVKDVAVGGRPVVINEVVNTIPDAVTSDEYYPLGLVTEFRYSELIGEALTHKDYSTLCDVFQTLLKEENALLFIDNHDTQRGRERPGSIVLTHKTPELYNRAQAFTLAAGYGTPRVMSSYYFQDTEAGPPADSTDHILDVVIKVDGTCGNGWVCEHRWQVIQKIVQYTNLVKGSQLNSCQAQQKTVSFMRGDDTLFWMTSDETVTSENVTTNLTEGSYCDLMSDCQNKYFVDSSGMVTLTSAEDGIVVLVPDTSTEVLSTTDASTVTTNANITVSFPDTTTMSNSTMPTSDTSTTIFNSTLPTPDTTTVSNNTLPTPDSTTVSNNTLPTPDSSTVSTIVNSTASPINDSTTSTNDTGTVSTTVSSVTSVDITSNLTLNTTIEPLTTDDLNSTDYSNTSWTTAVPSSSESVTTPGNITEPTTPPGPDWHRTVILVEKQTNPGQDVFIRGGIDRSRISGARTCETYHFENNPCVIPIKQRPLEIREPTPARDAWSVGDDYLDWYGPEPNQGKQGTTPAQGTPGQWTSSNPSGKYYDPLNTFGDHYWIIDVEMDCSRTFQGFFEFKGVLSNGWEFGPSLDSDCTGDGAIPFPYHAGNHIGRCGFINVYHWGTGLCEIHAFSSLSVGDTVIG